MPFGSEASVREAVSLKEHSTMKIMAIHDAKGNISATVVLPADAPPGAIRVEPGQTITEIDGHNLKFDAQKEQSYERLIEVIQNFRIEPIPSRAKLVKK
jgi:arginine/lysine/ornithine decarboxylase